MENKLVYIFNIGCQMNNYDSGQIKNSLFLQGYLETKIIEDANLIVVNTCTVRSKAENKAFSFIGRVAKFKKKDPSIILAVGGCLAQQYGAKILKHMSCVDIVFGTNAIYRLPDLLSQVQSSGCKIVDINIDHIKSDQTPISTINDKTKVSDFVTIMRGCNNYCTYCVVPYVRGKEISRQSDTIINEVKSLVSYGVKEVVLLGQNVNSYKSKNELIDFVQLLKKINSITNLKRIRFTTSNPKDLSQKLIDSFSQLDKLCNHIHLPVQSGNNTILKRMNRKYTIEDYIKKINELRSECKNISITSDFIVGFPGESNLQFKDTLNLVDLLRFDSSFIFSYSDRPNTIASDFPDKISEITKKVRINKLIALQNKITKEINCSTVGKIEKVLVEGLSNRAENKYYFGRTSNNKIVHFKVTLKNNSLSLKGKIIKVLITKANSHSLYGELLKC